MQTNDTPLLQIDKVTKIFNFGRQSFRALDAITLSVKKGETLGIVGESGCGKSTLGKVVLQLERPSSGTVFFNGQDLSLLSKSQMQTMRCKMQMIFQDPYASLNPRMTIEEIVGEGIVIHQLRSKVQRREKIVSLMEDVGLESSMLQRYPHEFSGGQRQRIGIARALAVDPQFIVCDEPLSALDVGTQMRIMGLLQRLKREKELTYLFISHDLHAVKQIADHVAVMYAGQVVEYAPTEQLFRTPAHPYTQALLAAMPIADPALEKKRNRLIVHGEPPSLLHPPSGCRFHPRCPNALPECALDAPMQTGDAVRNVTCHLYS